MDKHMENVRKTATLQFMLTGFTQDMAFRVFAFERMGSDRVRTKIAVRADLALSRRYGIPMQELPLLCRNLLERNDSGDETRTITFSEDDMCLHAKDRTSAKAAAAQRRKPPRRTPSENVGAAWRGHQPIQTARVPDEPRGIHEQKITETT
jgi:hypothetical protein